jgi:hypothetical protein
MAPTKWHRSRVGGYSELLQKERPGRKSRPAAFLGAPLRRSRPSVTDYTFRNTYYTLYRELGQWTVHSYRVSPVFPQTEFAWMARAMDKSFNTTIVNDSFDSFMARLVLALGTISAPAKRRASAGWTQVLQNATELEQKAGISYAHGFDLNALLSLPES